LAEVFGCKRFGRSERTDLAGEKAWFISKVQERAETFTFNASVSEARIPAAVLINLLKKLRISRSR